MRDMHKWKDKVELSLDNRQIFFLFFGLSVVGCFVFALGVMTGRKLTWEPDGRVAALSPEDSLDLLADATDEHGFTFKEGLAASSAEGLPETRDPAEPPRDEDEVKAEKKAAKEAEKAAAKQAAADEKQAADAKAAQAAKDAALASADAKVGKGDASASKSSDAGKKKAERRFTLQMKAFARQEEADAMADKLRKNGHEMRVEQAEVKGRTWYRVRLGAFDKWDDAVSAKLEFEKKEKVIAYVVSM